jgi:hypothetical protein
MNENVRKRHSCIDMNENGRASTSPEAGKCQTLPPDLPCLALVTLYPEVTSSLNSSKQRSTVKAEQATGA